MHTVLRIHMSASLSFVLLCFLLLAAVPGWGQVSVLTQHDDTSRTGANMSETTLTPSNVFVGSFGKIFSMPVDGFVFAQPLYVPGVSIDGGTHNVLYVATAHDSVFAFDADTGAEYWQTSLGTPVPSSVINTPNIQVEVGIIGTPVIDPSINTLFVVAKTYENDVQIFRLHALNIATGAEQTGSPVLITAQVNGTGGASSGGIVPFQASQENQRPALTLANGNVYLAFASHEDYEPYHGWVLAYSESTLQQVAVFNDTPNSDMGGIWMSGQGLVVDASGNLYCLTGNSNESEENNAGDYGQSFIKLSPSLTILDYFKAYNYDALNASDLDVASTGALAIPGTNYLVGGSKSGMMYVVNENDMGELGSGSDNVVQEWQADQGLWGNSVFWNSAIPSLYVWSQDDALHAYAYNGNGTFNSTPTASGNVQIQSGDGSGCLSVSSNGNSSGILWATMPIGDPDHATVPGQLYAFNAANVAQELWDSSQNATEDGFGNFAKFAPPTVVNGKVYVATDSEQVCAYGLLPNPVLPFADGTYKIVSDLSGFAVDDPSGGGAGTGVDQQTYAGADQQWNFALVSGNQYEITNVASGLALTGTTSEAQLTMQPLTGASNQLWTFAVNGTNYTAANVSTGQLLDDFNLSKTSGTPVGQWPGNGGSNQFWTITAVNAATVPAAPAGLSAAAGSQLATVTWSGSSGATSYNVYLGTASGGESATPVATGVTTNIYTVSDLTGGVAYYFQIAAVNSFGTSGLSNEASATPTAAPPPVPNGTFEIANVYSGFSLDDPNGAGAGTGVDQQTYDGTDQQWNLASVGGAEYSITSAANGLALTGATSEAQLTLQAYTAASDQLWTFMPSGSSDTIENVATKQLMDDFNLSTTAGTVVGQWPANGGENQSWTLTEVTAGSAAPTSLTATAGNAQVLLSWTGSSTATSYNVYRGTTSGGESGTAVATGFATASYTNTGLTNGVTYYFKVAAVNAGGTSGPSNEASATPVGGVSGSHQVSPDNATGSDLEIPGTRLSNGIQLEISKANGGANQKWNVSSSASPAGDFNLAVSLGSYCMEATGSVNKDPVEIYACNGSAGQAWNIAQDTSPAGFYELKPSNASSLCLDTDGTANGSKIIVASCSSQSSMQWEFH